MLYKEFRYCPTATYGSLIIPSILIKLIISSIYVSILEQDLIWVVAEIIHRMCTENIVWQN